MMENLNKERFEPLLARRQKLEKLRKTNPYEKASGEAKTGLDKLVGAFLTSYPAALSEGNEQKLLEFVGLVNDAVKLYEKVAALAPNHTDRVMACLCAAMTFDMTLGLSSLPAWDPDQYEFCNQKSVVRAIDEYN